VAVVPDTGWTDELRAGVPLAVWHGPGGVRAVVSGRPGGVSHGPWSSLNLSASTGDEPRHVRENRRRLLAAVGLGPTSVRWLRQVHGATVLRAEELPALDLLDLDAQPSVGDGLVTGATDLGLLAFAADCVPVVVARLDGTAHAVCHAGRRGLVEGVVEATVAALGGAATAAIGPCAGPGRYAVGADVAAELLERFGPEAVTSRGTADLPRCTELALAAAGVDRVDRLDRCTISDRRLFSHRRDGTPSGRQALLAVRRGDR
jgi:hypothetical protein